MIYNVIIAGGRGERFWPASTKNRPKQLLKILSDKTMLQETLARVSDFIPIERTLIVTGNDLKEKILSNNDFLDKSNILTEPQGKNTCLAIAFAAIHLYKKDPESIMVVLSTDHYIKSKEKLIDILSVATGIAAKDDVLMTIGINPNRPEIGYGYIEQGKSFGEFNGVTASWVKAFTEKPDKIRAQEYYVSRKHLWNAGMFIWSTKSLLDALKKYKPEIHEQLIKYSESIDTPDEDQAKHELFEKAENISIDVAILEKADNVVVMRGELEWDDIGSWIALERISKTDRSNNVNIGKTLLLDSYEVTAYNSGDGIICALGVSDLVIVKTDSVVFVCHKTRVDDIKELLKNMREQKDLEIYL